MFLPLNREEIEQIVMLQINGIKNMLAGNGITLEMTDEPSVSLPAQAMIPNSAPVL